MEDTTITLTQAEFDAKVEEAVANATKDLEAKHNKDMYALRKENKDLKNANLSQEEIEKRVREEQDEQIKNELEALRSFKKQTILADRLAKEGLPNYFKNDYRLINAEDGELDKAIKQVKKEYEDSLPKGNPHSTIITTSGNQPQVGNSDKAKAEFGQALKDLVGR